MSKKTDTVTVKFERAHGHAGVVIARGAVVELPEFWANKYIAAGLAVPAEPKAKAKAQKKPTQTKTK